MFLVVLALPFLAVLESVVRLMIEPRPENLVHSGKPRRA